MACAGGGAAGRATPTQALTRAMPSPTSPSAAGDPAVTVVNTILACREKDAALLRSFVAGTVPEGAIQALFARGTDVLLKRQAPAVIDDGKATVELRLEVHRDGEIETAERIWELERGADGVWRFTELPDCF